MLSLDTKRRNIEVRPPLPGCRHNTETIYVPHRFEVVGGISSEEWLRREMSRPNPLFNLFVRSKARRAN